MEYLGSLGRSWGLTADTSYVQPKVVLKLCDTWDVHCHGFAWGLWYVVEDFVVARRGGKISMSIYGVVDDAVVFMTGLWSALVDARQVA